MHCDSKIYICPVILLITEEVFFSIRFFGSNLRMLPVRNNAEIVRGMLTIAKVKIETVHKSYLVKLDMLCSLVKL